MPRLATIPAYAVIPAYALFTVEVNSCQRCPNRSSSDYEYDEATGRYYTHCLDFLPPERIWAAEVGTIQAWCPLSEIEPAVPPSPPSP